MANGLSTEVIVKRKVQDGWHVYTCDHLPGLFVASESDKDAYNDLPESIRSLIRLDMGVDCAVSLKLSYTEFSGQLRLAERARSAVAKRTKDLVSEEDGEFAFMIQAIDNGHNAQQ